LVIMLASGALFEVERMLDDVGLVHADASVALRLLNRAQQYVSLRYALLRTTFPITLVPGTALYGLSAPIPRLVRFLSAELDGLPLWIVPLSVLALSDREWPAHQASPSQPPQWVYPLGLSWLGLYPIPAAVGTMSVTALVAPIDLVSSSSVLSVPDAWLPRVIETAAGFLMLSSEKTYRQGLQHVGQGLGLKEAA
jgi:hypothetical protein